MELPVKLYELEVDTVLQMVEKRFNNDRTEGLARFYLNKVHYCDYKEKFADRKGGLFYQLICQLIGQLTGSWENLRFERLE